MAGAVFEASSVHLNGSVLLWVGPTLETTANHPPMSRQMVLVGAVERTAHE